MRSINTIRRPRRAFTRDDLFLVLDYEPILGDFRWKIRTHGRRGLVLPGDIAGGLNGDGYRIIKVFQVLYRAHHLAWLAMTGEWPPSDDDLDHKDRNRSNNAWLNIRPAPRGHNIINTAGRSNNVSGQIGVSFRKDIGKWHARIGVGKRIILLGNFERLEDAIDARKKAELLNYGEFSPSI